QLAAVADGHVVVDGHVAADDAVAADAGLFANRRPVSDQGVGAQVDVTVQHGAWSNGTLVPDHQPLFVLQRSGQGTRPLGDLADVGAWEDLDACADLDPSL